VSVPLHVLVLEDRRADAELVVRELRRAGFDLDWHLAASKSEYVAALDPTFDIILADYNLPDLNALQALHHLRQRGLEMPFIVITGNLGDEGAAECIKQGATDYLLKDRLGRLGPAVTRALEEKRQSDESEKAARRLRDVRERAEESLREANLSLEQRVADRTRELTRLNALLATSEATLEQRVAQRTAALEHETEQRRRAEEALHHGEKLQAIGQLTGGIVHSFNNTLQLIFHGMNLLRRSGLTDERRLELFDNLDGAAERARGLTNPSFRHAITTNRRKSGRNRPEPSET
jgi:CheY-like chemotaxis protein